MGIRSPDARTFALACQFEPVGTGLEPLVRGRVVAPTYRSLAGGTIVVTALEHSWSSGPVALDSDGSFAVRLRGVRNRTVSYHVRFFDEHRSERPLSPATLTYTAADPALGGGALLEQPISISEVGGVAMVVLRAGLQLGKRKQITFMTAARYSSALPTSLRLELIEGGGAPDDARRILGALEIPPRMLWRDLPAGSKVEFAAVVDEARMLRARAYLPLLDIQVEAETSLD